MTSRLPRLAFLLLWIAASILSACQAPPTPTTAPATAHLAPTSTPAPPAATATPDPANEPTIEHLADVWARNDPGGGILYLVITHDGQVHVAIASPDTVIEGGGYALDGATLTLENWDNCPEDGTYTVQLSGQGDTLALIFVADTCRSERIAGLTEGQWHRSGVQQ